MRLPARTLLTAALAAPFTLGAQARPDSTKPVQTLAPVTASAPAERYRSPGLRGFEERMKNGHGVFIGEDELRKSDNRIFSDVLRKVPGLTMANYHSVWYASGRRTAGQGQAGALGHSGPPPADPYDPKSPRGCWANVYLDGVSIYQGPPQVAPDMNSFQVRDLAGVEYYAGSASLPVQYSAIKQADCGVLLLWTRER